MEKMSKLYVIPAVLAATATGCAQSEFPVRSPVKPFPSYKASKAFWNHWSDGRAEVSGYRVKVSRYGELRQGQVALIYVTEPMDRRTWIKDDSGKVPKQHRAVVLKLNHMLNFHTGIYPYSVMTSVFSPVNGIGRERFAPVKIAFSAQEWCGHVYHQVRPRADRFESRIHSYFGSEGDGRKVVTTPPNPLYEDALLIQIRELDGRFNNGRDWSGYIVPSLWETRKKHVPLKAVPATITRHDAVRDGVRVTRFTVQYNGFVRVVDVEKRFPKRILGWSTSRGETAELLKTARLAYWKLNGPGQERHLARIGFEPPRRSGSSAGQAPRPAASGVCADGSPSKDGNC